MHVPSRHPFTYSADFIRSLAHSGVSRSEASRMGNAIAEDLGLEQSTIAKAFSWEFQKQNFGAVLSLDQNPIELPVFDASRLKEALLKAGFSMSDNFCNGLKDAMEKATEPVKTVFLNEGQQRHLADLVSLAMVGYALLKSDPGASETSHPAVAAFYPLVSDELEKRREKGRLEAEYRFGRPEDFDEPSP